MTAQNDRLHRRASVFTLALAALLSTLCPTIGSAASISKQTWEEFQFGYGSPSDWAFACQSCVPSAAGNSTFASAPPWTFSGPGTLVVADAFLLVDVFAVYDNNHLLGTTSKAAGSGSCGSDPAFCLSQPGDSTGTFTLGSGNHSITILHTEGIPGAGYFEVLNAGAAAPEPNTQYTLLGAGLICLSRLRRRIRT